MANSYFRNWLRFVMLMGFLAFVLPLDGQENPGSYDAHTNEAMKRGNEAYAAGKYEDAIKAFKEANKHQRNSCYHCYIALALAYSRIGDAGNAEHSSTKALATASDSHERAAAHTLKGSILMRLGESDVKRAAAAELEFRQALAEDHGELSTRFELGVALLKQRKDEEGTKELKLLLSLAPAGVFADQAAKLIADPRRARERFAPEFEVATLQGEKLSLSQFSGKVVVLDFWATWCAPCRASLPEIKDLFKRYPHEKLALISISADEDERAWKDFIAKNNMEWAQVRDADGQIRNKFNVTAFPTYLVIDGEGIIHQEIIGLDPQKSVAYRLRDALKSMRQLN